MTHEALPDEVIRLWPEGPPFELEGVGPEVEFRGPYGAAGDSAMLRNVSEPTLNVFRPPNGQSNGVGVIICPGGGRRLAAIEHEGTDVVLPLGVRRPFKENQGVAVATKLRNCRLE